jgi:AcrR family transcriptional regulator
MRKLTIQGRHDKANSLKGKDRVTQIINAARDLLLEDGYSGITMRKVADRCGIKVGNLSYYYRTKPALIHDLMEAVLQSYMVEFEIIQENPDLTAEEKFIAIFDLIMEDLSTPETTKFFPELWARANHDKNAAEVMNYIYEKVIDVFAGLVGELNSNLIGENRQKVALFIMACLEGHTIFIGYKKKWNNWAGDAENIAAFTLLSMIKSITVHDIENYLLDREHSIKQKASN